MARPKRRPVILLVAEAVTLAHFARIAALAKALDTGIYDIVVASDPRYVNLASLEKFAVHPIYSIPGEYFAKSLARGKPLYDANTLDRYVLEDLDLIDQVRPDLIIGDFRLSLAVSAPLRHVPYAAVVNAYWSPYADLAYPIPDLPLTRLLGIGIAQRLFDLFRPLVFALHARPLNQVRRRHGLPALGYDLRTAYSWGNYTLFADIPELIPTRGLPSNHRYLGPVFWSTDTALPDWWKELPRHKPVVCLTLGSSGKSDYLASALQALAPLPITLIVATLGKANLPPQPANVFLADYLPLEAALRRSSALVCNGGSLSTYQAMACGVPAIGVCSNLDQLLNMDALRRLGAGISLRASSVAATTLRAAVEALLREPGYARAAAGIGAIMASYDSGQRLRATAAEILA